MMSRVDGSMVSLMLFGQLREHLQRIVDDLGDVGVEQIEERDARDSEPANRSPAV